MVAFLLTALPARAADFDPAQRARGGTFEIAAGDYDGDGHTDFYFSTGGGAPPDLLFGTGAGLVRRSVEGLPGLIPGPARSVSQTNARTVAGDFDGDGRVELVVADGDSQFSHLLPPSTGTIIAQMASPTTFRQILAVNAPRMKSLAVARLDGDGVDDLVMLHSDGLEVVFNPLSSTRVRCGVDVPGYPASALTGIARTEGRSGRDALVITLPNGIVIIHAANAGRSRCAFTAPRPIPSGRGAQDVVSADIDGDGKEDVLSVHGNPDPVTGKRSFLNVAYKGRTRYRARRYRTVPRAVTLSVGDANNDGRGDVLVGGTPPAPTNPQLESARVAAGRHYVSGAGLGVHLAGGWRKHDPLKGIPGSGDIETSPDGETTYAGPVSITDVLLADWSGDAFDDILTASASGDGPSEVMKANRQRIVGGQRMCAGRSVTRGTRTRIRNGRRIYIGTPGVDVISGTRAGETFMGRGGRDTICGGSGHDKISGGPDGDFLYGGVGNDRLFGKGGADTLCGGPGADRLSGGRGADTLIGTRGVDRFPGLSREDRERRPSSDCPGR